MPEFNLIDHFDRRARLDLAEELKKPSSFLISTFFNRVKTFAVPEIDIDIRNKRRKMSAYVTRAQEGNLVDISGFLTRTFKTPALKPKAILTPDDVAKRLPMGDIYDDSSDLSANIAQLVAEYTEELDTEMIVRNEEWQGKQALFDAKIEALNDEKQIIATIDLKRDAALNVALGAGDKWDNASNDKLASLRKKRRLVKKISGWTPSIALLGVDAADLFLADEAIQKQIDKDVADRGRLTFDMRDDGAIFLGRIDGFDFWMYEEFVIDPSDDIEKLLVPEKKCLLASPQAPATRVYGSISATVDEKMVIIAAPRLVNIYPASVDPSGTVIQVHSSPAMITNHPNAYSAFDTF